MREIALGPANEKKRAVPKAGTRLSGSSTCAGRKVAQDAVRAQGRKSPLGPTRSAVCVSDEQWNQARMGMDTTSTWRVSSNAAISFRQASEGRLSTRNFVHTARAPSNTVFEISSMLMP